MMKPACRVVLALCLTLSAPSLASADAVELFRLLDGRPPASSKAASSTQRIQLHAEALQADRLSMPLGEGQIFDIVATEFDILAEDHKVWRGRFSGNDGRAVLTQKSGVVLGTFWTPEGFYQIGSTAAGPVLEKIEQDTLPPCANSDDPPATRSTKSIPAKAADPPNRIDVMTLYTPQALAGAGSTAQIEATIQHAIDLANTAFIDSDMVARFNLVHIGLIDYAESGRVETARDWLASSAEVAALRDQWCADLVSLIVERSVFCGAAYVMGSPSASFESQAFQATRRDCATSGLTLAHEHGHNMGFQHNPQHSAPPLSYPWSHGHFVNDRFRTVMSWATPCPLGCPQVPRFSNPQLRYNGLPTGTVNRNNSKTGNLTASLVANFRQRDACALNLTSDVYEIRSVDEPGKCIDIQGASGGNGALAQIHGCHGGQNQRWRFTNSGGGRFRLSALHSGKCLDVQGAGSNDGRNVQQYTCHGGPNQSWEVNPLGGGEVQFIVEHSGRCLEAKDAGFLGQQDILEQRSCGSDPRQRWILDTIAICGDGACTASESCSTCAADCGSCTLCGNGVCDVNENCTTCSADCPLCMPICGNGLCESADECLLCPGDCGSMSLGCATQQ